jgi:hypothetical protein
MNSKNALDKIMKVLGLTSISFFEANTDQGVRLKMEGELELGLPIYVSTEEGLIPAPPGLHKLEDGTEIEVDDEGLVKKINMGEMEEKETDEVKKEDKDEEAVIKADDMSTELFGDVELVDGSMIRMEGESEIVGRQVRKVGYDGSLTAIADGDYETKGGKVISIVGGAIQGVQSVSDNNKRKSGFAEYDWDQCMEDQLNQYGDEDTAKKVCGAIKAGNMSEGFTIAKTAEGAVVESKTFDVGEEVHVLAEDGSKEKAPDGEHQVVLKDESGNENKIRFETKDGVITQRENVEDESMVKMAEMFAQALKKLETKIDAYALKQKTLEGKLEKFSKQPAGERVYTQKAINEEPNPLKDKFEAFKKLRVGK